MLPSPAVCIAFDRCKSWMQPQHHHASEQSGYGVAGPVSPPASLPCLRTIANATKNTGSRGTGRRVREGSVRGEGVGHTLHRKRAVAAMISNQQRVLALTAIPGGGSSNPRGSASGQRKAVLRGGRRPGGGSVNQQKDLKAAAIKRPVRATFQNRIGESGWCLWPGIAEEQTMDDLRPGKIAGRIGHFGGCNVGVAPGAGEISAGGGGSQAIRMTGQAMQWGVREVGTVKYGQNCSICRSGLQVKLSGEREELLRPASHRATTVKDVLMQFLGNAVSVAPGAQARVLGWRASAIGKAGHTIYYTT
jgi:hypothetical protein